MPMITVSDATYAKLKLLAEPFVDTEESVILRAVNAELERRADSSAGTAPASSPEAVRLSPGSNQLAHTRLISATVDGQSVHRPKWNSLMGHMHVVGRKRLGSFDALRRASRANLRNGRYEENGYKYYPEADLSIQGVDANLACEHSFQLAKALAMPIKVTFEWREKDGAAHPGRTGVIEWSPEQS